MLRHHPVEQSRLGEPLTVEEFRLGYEETARIAGRYAIAQQPDMVSWMEDVADAAAMENPELYIAAYYHSADEAQYENLVADLAATLPLK